MPETIVYHAHVPHVGVLTWPQGDDALHEAARGGHLPVVLVLLQAGADVNVRNHRVPRECAACCCTANKCTQLYV
jgi:hypothetical protein